MDLKERLESNHVVVQRASTFRRTRTVFSGTVGPFQLFSVTHVRYIVVQQRGPIYYFDREVRHGCSGVKTQ